MGSDSVKNDIRRGPATYTMHIQAVHCIIVMYGTFWVIFEEYLRQNFNFIQYYMQSKYIQADILYRTNLIPFYCVSRMESNRDLIDDTKCHPGVLSDLATDTMISGGDTSFTESRNRRGGFFSRLKSLCLESQPYVGIVPPFTRHLYA
jgi:hypothetical protein